MASRRLRTFKRWMKSRGVECSDALKFLDTPQEGISVTAVCDLKEGEVVAKIPKTACLSIKTSGAREVIESAGLDGILGLSVALMYEISLGDESPWAGYFHLLPLYEDLPLLWTFDQLDSLLRGTELHKVVKEDKALIYEDWKESIAPLMDSPLLKLDPEYFGVEDYFAARSLIASRSFEIDDYHGSGMVPLADLFNHKTGAEDVHFTIVSSHDESEDEADDNGDDAEEDISDGEYSMQDSSLPVEATDGDTGENSEGGTEKECSSHSGDDPAVLEMIMVKDVKAGAEVFNTYGLLGNAALLHRYGFTEPDNPYDIVNIDLELVLQWSSSTFSSRYARARFSLWRRLDYSGCVSNSSEYFEISSNGEPQIELPVLLYIVLLPEDAYNKLDLAISAARSKNGFVGATLLGKHGILFKKAEETSKDIFLTEGVRKALVALADKRESLYGSSSIDDDVAALKNCCCMRDRKLYHALVLRVSERKILEKLRNYADGGARASDIVNEGVSRRKKLKKAI